MTLTIELTEEQAAALQARAERAGQDVAKYVEALIATDASTTFADLEAGRRWADSVRAIRERGQDASDLDIRDLINEGRL